MTGKSEELMKHECRGRCVEGRVQSDATLELTQKIDFAPRASHVHGNRLRNRIIEPVQPDRFCQAMIGQ